MNEEHPEDDSLLADLGDLLDHDEPLPEHVFASAAPAAFDLAHLDFELAQLAGSPPVALRNGVGGDLPDTLTYQSGSLVVELQFDPDGHTLAGQILPPGPADVTIQTRTSTTPLAVDQLGRFIATSHDSFFRFTVTRAENTHVVTPWIRR